jgi:hypothetical protein
MPTTPDAYRTHLLPLGRIFFLAVEGFAALIYTGGFLIVATFAISDKARPAPTTAFGWYMEVIPVLGMIGLLALWAGLISVIVLKKNIKKGASILLLVGLASGVIADISMFVGSASIGHGYFGLGFLGWMLVIAMYGGPLAICIHILINIKKPRPKGSNEFVFWNPHA